MFAGKLKNLEKHLSKAADNPSKRLKNLVNLQL